MADRLTQLQDALDNQLTMMYAAINYIHVRHPYGDVPGQPSQAPPFAPIVPPNTAPTVPSEPAVSQLTNGDTSPPQTNGPSQPSEPSQPSQSTGTEREPGRPPSPPPPHQPELFNSSMRELAQGLVLQEQQIEYLINSLPGLGSSEESQVKRMRELEAELREVEAERARAEREKERMVDLLGEVIGKVKRIP